MNTSTLSKLFSITLALLLTGSSLRGQAPAPFAEDEGLRFVSLFGNFDDMAYEHKGEVIPVKVSSGAFSEAYPMPKSESLVLFRELPLPPTAPVGTAPQRQILAEIPLLPGSIDSQLVLLAPNPGDTEREVRGITVDAMNSAHQLGTARLINLSSFEAAITFGKDVYKTKERTTDLMMPFPIGISRIVVAVELKEANNWMPAIHMQRRLNNRCRMYVIMINRQPTAENPLPVYGLVLFEYSRVPAQVTEQ